MKAALMKAFYRLSESPALRVNYKACRPTENSTGDPEHMAQVHPFQAFRYNPERVPFERVLTQPYDKISTSMQDGYYAADAHNLITVEKGRSYPTDNPQNNVYTRAAAAIDKWIREAIVVQDPAPSFYGYTQEYTVPGTGEQRTRRGFIGAGKLEEYSAGVVFRHEHTHSGPKADRLELLRHTRTHTGQLFMLYSDPQQHIDAILKGVESSIPSAMQLRDEYGVVHRLWVISDSGSTAAITSAMEGQKLVIADGHHRYETALNYRNERRLHAGGLHPSAPYAQAPYLFLRARSATGGAQAAGQGKNQRAETDHEVREADLHCRLPASGFRFPVWMVAQNFRCGACLADDRFGSNCSRGIFDDLLGHEREQLRFADHTSGKRSARHFYWALPDRPPSDVSRRDHFAFVRAAGAGFVLGGAGFCAGDSCDCVAHSE